jgi:mRNA-degrading endonuclease YafQ of YafQ-DinJ toxin-antitoxin module
MSTEKYLLPNEKQRLDEAKITGKDILKNTKLNTAYRSHKLKGKLPESN